MGGGCNVTPAEKLRASQAILPPFIIGEDENQETSQAVFIYGDKSNIVTSNENLFTITGNNTNYTNKTWRTTTNLFFGSYAFISNDETAGQFLTDGTTITGYQPVVYSKENEITHYTVTNRGNMFLGYLGCILDHHIKNGEKLEEYYNNDKGVGFFNQGVLTTGCDSKVVIAASNEGVVLLGARNKIQSKANNGVIIQGSSSLTRDEKSYNEYYDSLKGMESNVDGMGLYFRGAILGSTTPNSLIQVSTDEVHPTLLNGYLKLDKTFNLKDANGKDIIKNGVLVNQ